MALDDRYANKFAPLDSTTIYHKPGHKLLYTLMTGEMKCPRLYLCLTHAPTRSIIIWSTSYHHVIILVHRSWLHLLFTVASVHRCQVITQLAFTLASSQVLSWSSPPWSHDSISCLICNALLHHICELCNISKPFYLYGMSCSHKCICGLITCVSHIKHN